MCEQLINSYLLKSKKKLHFGLSSVRAGNVIGGGDFSKYRIIPDIIKNSKTKVISLRNPNISDLGNMSLMYVTAIFLFQFFIIKIK